jgi:hypothetical protein
MSVGRLAVARSDLSGIAGWASGRDKISIRGRRNFISATASSSDRANVFVY